MEKKYSTRLFKLLEFLFAIVFIGIAIYIVGLDFFGCNFVDNKLFLDTTDALPIYTKVNYAVECLRNGEWPSWFPYWYCGTSVSQYYPPLTYVILIPIDYFIKNDNICLQIYVFFGLLIGGMGIWYLFKHFIGSLWGILAGVLYVCLPYFTISFLLWGTIAQVPIIAIAPWHLVCSLNFYKNPKWYWWIAIWFLTFLLLLSHVMHAFMIVICVFVPMLILSIWQKKQFSTILMWGIGTGLAVGILGFWWVTGVLPLENTGVPYLAPDAAKDVTANLTWFFPYFQDIIKKVFPEIRNTFNAHFPFVIIFISVISFIFIKKEKNGFKKTVLQFLYIQTVFSFVFSFGSYLPFYKYIPLANQLVPGRILTQSAIGAVILTAYFIGKLFLFIFRKINKSDKHQLWNILCNLANRACAIILIFVISIFIYQGYNYFIVKPTMISDFSIENSLYSKLDNKTSNFEKGRLAWFGSNFGSMYAYFAGVYNCNIVSGWNIEGTSMGEFLRYQNVTLLFEKKEYILRNIYDMNVQTCFVNKAEFPWLDDYLRQNNFEYIDEVEGIDILKRKNNSYFMEQTRNALAIGKASSVFLSEYPWFAKGSSANPTEYNMEYFKDFKIVYYCEPKIDNQEQLKLFEQQIKELSEMGKKIFVEFGRTIYPNPICGVSSFDHMLEGNYTIKSEDAVSGQDFYTSAAGGQIVELIGLDHVLYKLNRTTGDFSVDILGTKRVGNNDIFFIGGPIGQLKTFAFNYFTGNRAYNEDMVGRDQIISKIFSGLLNDVTLNRNLDLPIFSPENIKWEANSCSFHYNSESDKRIMASITYTPRWCVYVDNVEIKVDKMDNMIVFNLPQGQHDIKMVYGMTIYGKIGIGITVLSLSMVLLMLIFYNKVIQLLNTIVLKFLFYLEILNEDKQTEINS